MKEFRKNLALAIDGGGIRGTIVARALAVVEETAGFSFAQRAGLFAGTSTGSIISAALSHGLPASRIHQLYVDLAGTIFPKTLRSRVWPLTRYRYSNKPLEDALTGVLGQARMGDLWNGERKDLIIVLRDLVQNRNLFVKSWKPGYQDWLIWKAVVASSTVPTYFPVFEGQYIDGGVGSYSNPSYIAAFEIGHVLQDWKPEETTLISVGTGRTRSGLKKGEADRFHIVRWAGPILDAFTVDAALQQVELVHRSYKELDFRRFDIDLKDSIAMDDVTNIPRMNAYGEELGQKILNDQWEPPAPLDTVNMG